MDVHKALAGDPVLTTAQLAVSGAATSKVDADALRAAILAIPESKRTQVLSAFDRGRQCAAYAALNAIDGKVATTYIRTVREVTINRELQRSAGRGLRLSWSRPMATSPTLWEWRRRESPCADRPSWGNADRAEPETAARLYIPLAT